MRTASGDDDERRFLFLEFYVRVARCAGAEEEEKERDCGGIFDLFDLPPLTPI